MKNHYDNSDRLDTVTEKDWRDALDQLTAYLTWRLRGKTARGAHSEKALGMPAFDYYQEEAVVKLIEGEWKWQERFTLGKQLEKIAAGLITKNAEKWERAHPWEKQDGTNRMEDVIPKRKPDLIEFSDDMEQYSDILDDDGKEEVDETYEMVMTLVADDDELVLYVQAIQECNSFQDLPERMGISIKRVYRLQEKLMRRLRKVQDARMNG